MIDPDAIPGLPAELMIGLEETPRRLRAALGQVPRDRLDWRPAEWGGSPGESFTAIEHVCHLRDIERDGYHVRLRRLLDEKDPQLVSIDGYALAAERRYAAASVREALDAFENARADTLAIARDLRDEDLGRTGSFAEYGRVSVRGLLHYLHSHDQQHLACLEWLLGKMASADDRGARERG